MQSETIGALAGALAKAQAEIQGAVKDATNPHFRSRYADLSSVWDAIRAPLTKHGLSIVQAPTVNDAGSVLLKTTLMHSSGEWIASLYPINPIKADPQGYGSALTYARRYCLASIAGVAPEDDDGEAASGRAAPPSTMPTNLPKVQTGRAMIPPAGTVEKMRSLLEYEISTARDVADLHKIMEVNKPHIDKLHEKAKGAFDTVMAAYNVKNETLAKFAQKDAA